MSDDVYLKAWLDAEAQKYPEDAIDILRERFIPRTTGPHDGLIERLEAKDEWTNQRPYFHAHEKSLEAAAAIASLQAELDEARASVETLDYMREIANDLGFPSVLEALEALGDKQ